MIEVWHIKDVAAVAQARENAEAVTGTRVIKETLPDSFFEKVATVDTDDLEVAWRWTNNVDTSWSMEPHRLVTVTAPLHIIKGETYGRRSSMVGDMFIKNGVRYRVAMLGFEPI